MSGEERIILARKLIERASKNLKKAKKDNEVDLNKQICELKNIVFRASLNHLPLN